MNLKLRNSDSQDTNKYIHWRSAGVLVTGCRISDPDFHSPWSSGIPGGRPKYTERN